MGERFGARNPESMRLRFHCQTAAASLTRPQPQINIVRTGLQALAAVLGGYFFLFEWRLNHKRALFAESRPVQQSRFLPIARDDGERESNALSGILQRLPPELSATKW